MLWVWQKVMLPKGQQICSYLVICQYSILGVHDFEPYPVCQSVKIGNTCEVAKRAIRKSTACTVDFPVGRGALPFANSRMSNLFPCGLEWIDTSNRGVWSTTTWCMLATWSV